MRINTRYSKETYIEILNAASKIGRIKDIETLEPLLKHKKQQVKKLLRLPLKPYVKETFLNVLMRRMEEDAIIN